MRDAHAQRVNEECAMLVLTQLAEQFFQNRSTGRRARFSGDTHRCAPELSSRSTILCRPASSSRSSSP